MVMLEEGDEERGGEGEGRGGGRGGHVVYAGVRTFCLVIVVAVVVVGGVRGAVAGLLLANALQLTELGNLVAAWRWVVMAAVMVAVMAAAVVAAAVTTAAVMTAAVMTAAVVMRWW